MSERVWHTVGSLHGTPDMAFIGDARPVFGITELSAVVHHERIPGLIFYKWFEQASEDTMVLRWGRYVLFRDYNEMLQSHVRTGHALLRQSFTHGQL